MKSAAEAPEHDVHKQISISSVVMADESSTMSREVTITDLPAHWVDGLLEAVIEVPLGSGEVAAVQIVLDAMARVMPTVHVGATMVRDGETTVLRAASASDEGRLSGERSTRMFPSVQHERALDFQGSGVTLHLGSDNHPLDDSDAVIRFGLRAADAMRVAIDRIQGHEHAVALRRELDAQREQLIFAEKLATLGQMAAGLVHELNNPLTAIVAYTDFLIKRSSARGED